MDTSPWDPAQLSGKLPSYSRRMGRHLGDLHSHSSWEPWKESATIGLPRTSSWRFIAAHRINESLMGVPRFLFIPHPSSTFPYPSMPTTLSVDEDKIWCISTYTFSWLHGYTKPKSPPRIACPGNLLAVSKILGSQVMAVVRFFCQKLVFLSAPIKSSPRLMHISVLFGSCLLQTRAI